MNLLPYSSRASGIAAGALFLVFPRAMSTTRRRFIASSLLEAVPEWRDRERQQAVPGRQTSVSLLGRSLPGLGKLAGGFV